MKSFSVHNLETAPKSSREILEVSKKNFGMIPNLHGVLAESPVALKAYTTLHELFLNSSFSPEEITVVWQTINIEHNCHYCIPAHTAVAYSMKIDEEIIKALNNKITLPTQKLEVLRETTLIIVRNRGYISEEQLNSFFAEGFTNQNLLDIILGISQKTISNYVNHIFKTPIDKPFEKFILEKK